MQKNTLNRTLPNRRRCAGNMLIYATVTLTALFAMASLAVDLGRAQVAKTQLRNAADAAAMYATKGISDNSWSAKAIAAAAQNTVDGTALVLQAGDIATVTWNASTGTITAGNPTPNAVQITARRTNARGTAIPMLFAGVLGKPNLDLTAISIARFSAAVNVTNVANSRGNPWLAGMPNGTTGNSFDTAPANSPALANTGITLTSGATLTFNFTGQASHKPTAQSYDGDGDQSRMIYNCNQSNISVGREHGKANLTCPIGSVVGVFLTDTQPNLVGGALPPDLDFSSVASRDFASLAPALRQPFFIGNGKREDESTLQNFIVPTGATRLYIGIMDGQQWSDNSGSFSTTTNQPATTSLVK